MPTFVDAITSNASACLFRVANSDADHPRDWELEPLRASILSDTDSDGLHVMKAPNVLPDGTIRECYMDMNLPERVSDSAFFVENGSIRYGDHHEFPGQIMPAVALDCFGVYELFYSRTRPEIGIDILRRGLAIAERKRYIAQDLGYIYRDERRFAEAAEMFKIVVEEEPCSQEELPSSCLYYIYGELAGAYAEIGDVDNERKYLTVFKQAEARGIARARAIDRRDRLREAGIVLVLGFAYGLVFAAVFPVFVRTVLRDQLTFWQMLPASMTLFPIGSLVVWQISRLRYRRRKRAKHDG